MDYSISISNPSLHASSTRHISQKVFQPFHLHSVTAKEEVISFCNRSDAVDSIAEAIAERCWKLHRVLVDCVEFPLRKCVAS